LIRLTTEAVEKYFPEYVVAVSAVAQQISPTVKLDAVIAVGKKRYWQTLASTVNLSGNQAKIVLQKIHQDIVRIWNLQDPNKLLESEEFKELIAAMVTEQDVLSLAQMSTSLTMLAALAGIVSAVSGPAAPIVVPIAAVFVVGHWAVLIFKQASIVVQRLMFYIVALTLIMQIIFAIATTTTDNVVSCRLIKVALKTFCDSQKHTIHSAIKRHLERPGLHFGRDAVLEKITELIESNPISPEDIDKIKIMMKDFDIKKDEPWVQAP